MYCPFCGRQTVFTNGEWHCVFGNMILSPILVKLLNDLINNYELPDVDIGEQWVFSSWFCPALFISLLNCIHTTRISFFCAIGNILSKFIYQTDFAFILEMACSLHPFSSIVKVIVSCAFCSRFADIRTISSTNMS